MISEHTYILTICGKPGSVAYSQLEKFHGALTTWRVLATERATHLEEREKRQSCREVRYDKMTIKIRKTVGLTKMFKLVQT